MKVQEEKKSAIKLINQYAEQYKRVDLENKSLLNEIADLKKNLKISKEIIESFFKPEQKEKSKIFLRKTKEEIQNLNSTIDSLRKEVKECRDKNTYYEIILSESILKYRDCTDDMNTKIFFLENLIKKKDSVICYLNLKLNSLYESMYLGNNDFEPKEIFLVDPSSTSILMNNELANLKEENNALNNKLLKLKEQIRKYRLEKANLLKRRYSYDKNSSNSSSSVNSDEKNNEQNSNETAIRVKTKENNNDKETKNTLNKDEINFSIDLNQKNFETEEWFTILKKVKITKEMVIKLAKTRIGESIEQLVRIIMEKNMQIRVIYNENNNLTEKNTTLTVEIEDLKEQIKELKKNNKILQKQSINFDFAFTLTENEKKKLELAIQEEKVKQYQHFEKYLDEFNTKTQRINDSIVEEEINECFKNSMTNDTTKKQNVISEKVESFFSETLKNMKTF
jgi:hypothetical protein